MPTPPYPAALAMCGKGKGMLITRDPEKVFCVEHDAKTTQPE